jgi:hypothetical protein
MNDIYKYREKKPKSDNNPWLSKSDTLALRERKERERVRKEV